MFFALTHLLKSNFCVNKCKTLFSEFSQCIQLIINQIFLYALLFLKGAACRGTRRCGWRQMPPCPISSFKLRWFRAGMARYISRETALRRSKRSLQSCERVLGKIKSQRSNKYVPCFGLFHIVGYLRCFQRRVLLP